MTQCLAGLDRQEGKPAADGCLTFGPKLPGVPSVELNTDGACKIVSTCSCHPQTS